MSNGNRPMNVEAEFRTLCDELNISEDVRKKALLQLNSLITGHALGDFEHETTDLVMCVLYMALVDSRMPYGPLDPQLQCGYLAAPCVTLTDLLCHTNINIATFFKHMHLLKESFLLSEAVQHHLLGLEKNYCIVSALFYTFERLCRSVFREDPKMDEDSNEENVYFRGNMPPVPETEGVSFRKKLCWTVFLHAKNHFLVDIHDLNHAVLLLLCCLEFILRTTPSFLLNSPYDVIRIGCMQSTENRTTNMLTRLAEQVKTSIEEVQLIQQNATEPFFQELPHVECDLDIDNLIEQYDERYKKNGDINELLFLRHDPHLIPSDHHKSRSSIEQNMEVVQQPTTPIRTAMNTVQQLKSILANASDTPSDELNKYFKSCSTDPTTAVSKRLKELRAEFTMKFLEFSKSSETTIADQRFTMALRLYFRVMESMLHLEHERLSTNDFSILLCSDCFHRSLLAASVELVLMTYGLSRCPSSCDPTSEGLPFSFPWVLEVFHLEAFDFFKVLESYIKAEPKLTREIVKHLQWVEHMILESIAWKEGSSLYQAIQSSDAVVTRPSSPTSSPSNQEHCSSSKTAADMFLSPMTSSGILPPTPTKSGGSESDQRSSPHKDGGPTVERVPPRRSQSLNLFFSKVGHVGYEKMKKLCNLLGVTRDVQHKIWTCLEYCFNHKPGLLKNRHIDQIIMCSLYGICKVTEREVKFKTIVQMYRSLPNVDQAYKNVFIKGNDYDSIIGFYNKVFMQNMKSYILQFSNNKTMTPTLSPVPKQSGNTVSPVYSVPGRRKFFVSPLKETPFKPPPSPSQLTPRSRLLYSFGEGLGASQKLRAITESVSAFGRPSPGKKTPKSLKRLHFDHVAGDDDEDVLDKMPKIIKKLPVDVSPHKMPPQNSIDVQVSHSS